MLEGVLKVATLQTLDFWLLSFNPWYVGGGVKSYTSSIVYLGYHLVSILGMLEGVLKDCRQSSDTTFIMVVSILGMLEGVLKA